ncbi:IS1096 element passenger TnpR family protein [Cupriavidus sp. PET2-C1]
MKRTGKPCWKRLPGESPLHFARFERLPRYAEFLAALQDQTHAQHDDFRSWVGGVFDPAGFDVNAVNARLRAIR